MVYGQGVGHGAWAYFQFKNGRLGELTGDASALDDLRLYMAWDRSVGAVVCYER